jgi:hypothetical protein
MEITQKETTENVQVPMPVRLNVEKYRPVYLSVRYLPFPKGEKESFNARLKEWVLVKRRVAHYRRYLTKHPLWALRLFVPNKTARVEKNRLYLIQWLKNKKWD